MVLSPLSALKRRGSANLQENRLTRHSGTGKGQPPVFVVSALPPEAASIRYHISPKSARIVQSKFLQAQPLIFLRPVLQSSVVSSCVKTMMRTNRSPVLHAAERAAVRKDALQAACHVPDFYHRRVQRRTSAGCARYSTASGVQQHAIRVEPWNAVGSFKGASSRRANAG